MKLSWVERESQLNAVLIEIFPDLDPQVAKQWSRSIGGSYSSAMSFQKVERSERPVSKDVDSMNAAINALERASKHVREIGWHGGKATNDLASLIVANAGEYAGTPAIGVTESGEVIAGAISKLANELREAEKLLSKTSDFGHQNSRRTKPSKTGAEFTADGCALAYFAVTDDLPKVSTSTTDNRAYGLFLGLVSKVFEALEIDASPETWARSACKKAKQKGRKGMEESILN